MKILLVDDSKSARYALRLQLQGHGIRVETTDAAESALERIRKAPPDAIFMDQTMPGMNGLEALDIVKSTPGTEHIPVVMCASNDDPDFIEQARRKDAFDVLAKPTTQERLADLLSRLRTEAARAKVAAARTASSASLSINGAAVPTTPDSPGALVEAQLDARIRALLEPLMDDLAKRLSKDLLTEIDGRIASGLDAKAQQLRKELLEVQSQDGLADAPADTRGERPNFMRRIFSRRRRSGSH